MLCWGAVKWVPETAAYDEAFDRSAAPRSHYRPLVTTLESFTLTEIDRRERLQKLALMNQGITFTVYGEKDGLERIFPFDFVPRIIPAARVEARSRTGSSSASPRSTCSSLDIYQEQKCLQDGSSRPSWCSRARSTSASCSGCVAAAQDLHPRGRHRPHPRRARRVPRPGGQLPLPERRVLRAGEPHAAESRLPRVLRLATRCARSRTTRRCSSTRCCTSAPRASREPGRGRADARHPQLRLLRALLPRARDGRAAGRGARPPRRGQPRLHARPPAGASAWT